MKKANRLAQDPEKKTLSLIVFNIVAATSTILLGIKLIAIQLQSTFQFLVEMLFP